MAGPANVRREPSLAIICSLMRGLEWDREYCHSRAQGDAAGQYVEIREDVNHHREIEAELRALGYEYKWQQKRWCIWCDRRYIPAFSPDLHDEDRPAEEPSAPTPTNGGHHPGAATLGDFVAVAQRCKAKSRPLPLRPSGPSSDVELAQRVGPSASSSSAAPQRVQVVRACERVCSVPCKLRVARDQAAQQNAALDGAIFIA